MEKNPTVWRKKTNRVVSRDEFIKQETDYNSDFNAAPMLAHNHNKRYRHIFEVGAISLFPSLNNHSGFFNISLFL